MKPSRFRAARRHIALGTLLVSALAAASSVGVRAADEVRALWVVRTTLTSQAAIDAMVTAARNGGFNTLLVQVRGRADAYYANGIEPRPVSLADTPAFDPLAATIARAHDAGLSVHAWINVNLVSSASDLPASRDHVVYRHPEWLMVPRALGESLARVDPKSPEYLGRLTRYVRSQPATIEGLYLSPVNTGAIDYTVDVVRDVVRRYKVDGVHLDYARFPGEDFDYSADALSAFRRSVAGSLLTSERQKLDARLARDPFAYVDTFPDRWRAFRSGQLTRLVERIRDAVKQTNAAAIVSAAVAPDSADASNRYLQNWRDWVARDLIDVVCPMAYTTDARLFAAQIASDYVIAGRHPLWAGIGAYRLSPAQIVENVQAARRVGAGGIILFSYDSLAEPARGPEYLAQVGRSLVIQ